MADTVDTSSDKYKVALKFVNKILVNLEKDEVDKLTGFKDIDREDIIKEINKKTLNEMEGEIFKHFSKRKCNYYQKINTITLTVLRGMMKELGLKFAMYQKDLNKIIDGQSYRKTHSFYSIKLIK